MINNNAASDRCSQPLSREAAFELLRRLSKDDLLDQLHIDHFNNLTIVHSNGR